MRRLAVVLALLVFLPCAAAAKEFRVGLMPAKESLPFYAEEKLGTFRARGIELVIVPFRSALERDSAFEAGKIDGAVNDVVGTLLLKKSGRNIKILRTIAAARKGTPNFRIMASPAASTPKEIAISSNTVIEYVTDRMLEKKGMVGALRKTEVKAVPLRMQLLLEGKVGHATIAEPLASYIEMKGSAALATDEEVKGSHVLFVARGDLDPAFVKTLLGAFDEASRQVNQRKGELKNLLWAKLSLPDELKTRYVMPDLNVGEVPARGDVGDVISWMIGKNLLKEPVPYDALIFR